jgi:hypothetical protein
MDPELELVSVEVAVRNACFQAWLGVGAMRPWSAFTGLPDSSEACAPPRQPLCRRLV